MRRPLIALATLLLAATAARAEVYVWRDASGTTRMSNVTPPWYSPSEPSRIRTRVMLNGELIDDTGLAPEARDRLRGQRAKAEAWSSGRATAPSVTTSTIQTSGVPAASPTNVPPGPPSTKRPGAGVTPASELD